MSSAICLTAMQVRRPARMTLIKDLKVPNGPHSLRDAIYTFGLLEAHAETSLDDVCIAVVPGDHAIPRDAGQPTVGQPIARRHGDQTGQAAITGAVLRQIVIFRD